MSVQIEVTDLHKTYGKNEVLKGISAKFNKGDVVCIIGPSGSGKSTFLRTLNGLEDATSGDVIINGYNLTDKNTDINLVRQHVGMVFQHFNLFPNMTVLENIMYAPVELKKLTKTEAKEDNLDNFLEVLNQKKYIRLSGYVWEDKNVRDNLYNSKNDKLVKNVTVRLKDKDGNIVNLKQKQETQ